VHDAKALTEILEVAKSRLRASFQEPDAVRG
jgi:hypothetical protein